MQASLTSISPNVALPMPEIASFCRRWQIQRLELFGSALRADFSASSDLDFLVTFAADCALSLMDLSRAEDELGKLVGRRVELVERDGVERSSNWIRRNAVLSSAQCIYEA